jgi:hypothetical protein
MERGMAGQRFRKPSGLFEVRINEWTGLLAATKALVRANR